MTSCNKNGECLIQCECECYNEEINKYNNVCTCGHREHNGYCPSICCIPIECRNYKYCNEKQPKFILDCHDGACVNCHIQMGKHKTTDIIDMCPVCLENKIMIILKCNHTVCNNCWYNITKVGFGDNNEDNHKPLCPLCRNLNNWCFK